MQGWVGNSAFDRSLEEASLLENGDQILEIKAVVDVWLQIESFVRICIGEPVASSVDWVDQDMDLGVAALWCTNLTHQCRQPAQSDKSLGQLLGWSEPMIARQRVVLLVDIHLIGVALHHLAQHVVDFSVEPVLRCVDELFFLRVCNRHLAVHHPV